MDDSIAMIVAIIGACTGLAAIYLQWRQQVRSAEESQAELVMSAHEQAVKEADASAEQLAKISSLSIGLLKPLQDQVDVLSSRVSIMEGQVQRYRRWIVELMLITQQYAGRLQDAKLHDMVFTEIAADGTITALIEMIESPKAGETLDAPGLSGTGRLRTLKPR